MSQFIDSIKEVKKNYSKYDDWEQNQADDAARREYLAKTVDMPKDKVELTEAKAKAVVRAAQLLDKRSEDNCENTERSFGMVSTLIMMPFIFLPSAIMKMKLPKNVEKHLTWVQLLVILGIGAGVTLWGNEKQKEASRVGRFQAKQHELKDVKNFVVYTPEQIEAARILAKNIPDKKDEKGISKVFKDMKQMSQDKVEYKKWLEERIKNKEDIQKVLNTEFTPEQIAQGEEDKEIIVNIVKDVNIKAEEYSENSENVYDTLAVFSGLGGVALGFIVEKLFKKIPPALKGKLPALSGLVVGLLVLIQGTAEQKKAANIGRFIKRREILENPKVLMAYTDEQLKQVENIKAPEQKKGFFEKIGSNFKFLKTYLQDKKDYEKYLKTEGKETEKLYEALEQAEVSPTQLKNAQNLQEKTFRAFDKIDEMSQRYSEDIEAGTEIAKQASGTIWGLSSAILVLLVPILTLKGKMPIHKLAKWASNIALDKGSSIKKLIDSAYEIVSKDKKLKENLSKAIFIKDARKELMKNPKLKEILNALAHQMVKHLPEISSDKSAESAIKKILDTHFKKDAVSKWFRNMVVDISKLWTRNKLNSLPEKPPKEIMDKIKFAPFKDWKNTYKNYKTLINSAFAGGLPIIGIVVGVPYAFNSWLTNIQKKAGKIGIMKAMEEIDNPKLYIDSDDGKSRKDKKQYNPNLLPAA